MMNRGLKITFFVVLGIPFLVLGLFLTGWLWPMHASVNAGIKPVVWILAKSGMADSKMPGFKGGCFTPLQIAAKKGDIDIVDILLDAGADTLFNGCGSFFHGGMDVLSASVDQPELLEHLLAVRGIDANIRSVRGSPPVFSTLWCHSGTAMIKGNIPAELNHRRLRSLKLLLDHGADINARGSDEGAPLASAALFGCTDVVRELIARKADVGAADQSLEKHFAMMDDDALRHRSPPEASRIEGIKESIRLIKRAAGK